MTTVAGNGEKGVPQDGGDAWAQPLVDPRAIALDSKGNLHICERGGHALRVVDTAGKIRTVAGTGQKGAGGLGGPPESCPLDRPHGALPHPRSGEIYVSDSENHRVIRIEKR